MCEFLLFPFIFCVNWKLIESEEGMYVRVENGTLNSIIVCNRKIEYMLTDVLFQ